ncbi:MAG: hypothetical protein HY296_08080 [Thaumarchaeota archaeon]|nr:hypothetical protein [Nitrososphaerota archaeon]
MRDATKAFLKAAYREFYFRRADSIEFPDQIESREFGYIPFGGSMVRHLTFRRPGEAAAELLRQTPSSVYCSNARYESPAVPMDEKGWKGAELIFDIDATDIPTQCKRGHDLWFCGDCHSTGKLPRPAKCPKCEGPTEEYHGTCEVCMSASKEHTLRVVDLLTDDFGVASETIRLYFSGNRGFHIHVFDPRFDLLDPQGRAEIADYVRGGSLPAPQTIASTLRRAPHVSPESSLGWMKRITSYVESKGNGYPGTVQKLVSEAISSRRALIDTSVTTDIHRVFRLAGTLHGDTGMCKMRLSSIESFDPTQDAVVLSSEPVALEIRYSPQLTLKGMKYGPYKGTVESLPAYAAVPILTKGFGEVKP